MPCRESILRDELFRNRVRLVLALALFVLHHAALQIQRLLAQVEVSHAVRLHPQRVIHRGRRHILEIIRAVVVGRAVQVRGADALHGLDIAALRMVAAAKHQVLEKMRETRLPQLFVLRPHVIPGVDRDNRRLVVLMHNQRKPVLQHKFLVRNIHVFRLSKRPRRSTQHHYHYKTSRHPIPHLRPPFKSRQRSVLFSVFLCTT